jgi:hypothetical protein
MPGSFGDPPATLGTAQGLGSSAPERMSDEDRPKVCSLASMQPEDSVHGA